MQCSPSTMCIELICEILYRVKFSTVSEFFDQIEAEDSERLSEWKGELYLELHNATYTTQANVCYSYMVQ